MSHPTASPNGATSSGSSGGGGGGGLLEGHVSPAAFMKDIQKTHAETLQFIQWILKIVKAVSDLMAYPALILLRRNLGERTLSTFAALVAWFVVALVATACSLQPAYLLCLALPCMYVIHGFVIARRKKRGVRHYSFCRGDSYFDFLLPHLPHFNRGVLEPLLLLLAAVLIYRYGDQFVLAPEVTNIRQEPFGVWVFSTYLSLMGLGLLFVEVRLRRQERNTLLDQIDQQIIGTYFAGQLNDQDEVADEGFAVAELASWSPQQKQMFADTLQPEPFGYDDPKWNELLDPPPNPDSGMTAGSDTEFVLSR